MLYVTCRDSSDTEQRTLLPDIRKLQELLVPNGSDEGDGKLANDELYPSS
jgi:hypothetical protein